MFGKLGEATFPGEPDSRRNGSRAREEEKRKRPGRKARVRAGWMPGQERLGGGPTPQRRESTKAGPRVVGAKERVVGGKARRDPPAFPVRPRAVIPGSDGQGHRPRGAGASSSRLARPRHGARVPWSGRVSRCTVRLCVPAGRRASETVRILSACGSVPGAARASCRCAGVGKASRTHQVQSWDTHRVRPEAHSELRRHGRSRREPRRARSPEDPPELRHGRPPP